MKTLIVSSTLILALFLISGSFGSGGLEKLRESLEPPCSDLEFHMKFLLDEFLKDQMFLVIVEENHPLHTPKALFLFKCIFTNFDIPYMRFSSVSDLRQFFPNGTANYYAPTTVAISYVIITESLDSISLELSTLAQMSPNSKYAFIFRNGSLFDGGSLLKVAWNGHLMKRIIVIIPMVGELNAMAYNPFQFEIDSEAYGRIYRLTLNVTNFQKNIRNITTIIDEQDDNLNGYPLKVYMFNYPTMAKAVYNKSNPDQVLRFDLLDGDILQLFQKWSNFTSKFVGNISTNTFTGSIGAIDNFEADLACNTRIITDYYTENTVFLSAIVPVNLVFIVPKIYTTRSLNAFLYSLFDVPSQVLMVFVFIVLMLTLYLLNHLYERMTNIPEGNSLPRAFLIVSSTQYFISIRFTRVLKGHQQILIGAMLFYGVIVSNNYQSGIVKQLASKVSDKNIYTLEKLIESNLTLYYSPNLQSFITPPPNSSEDSFSSRLFNRQKKLFGPLEDAVKDMLANRSSGILLIRGVALEFRARYYDNHTGDDLIHIVPESPGHFFNSYITTRTSPYHSILYSLLQRFIEVGIIAHEQFKNEVEVQYLAYINRGRGGFAQKDPNFVPISAAQLRTLFIVWSFMLTIAVLALVLEIFGAQRCALKKKLVKCRKDCQRSWRGWWRSSTKEMI